MFILKETARAKLKIHNLNSRYLVPYLRILLKRGHLIHVYFKGNGTSQTENT